MIETSSNIWLIPINANGLNLDFFKICYLSIKFTNISNIKIIYLKSMCV